MMIRIPTDFLPRWITQARCPWLRPHLEITRARRCIDVALALTASFGAKAAAWDTFPDTWAATDALHRSLPAFAHTGAPRADRTVGLFYFLWLGPHTNGGPWDITKILARDPSAITNGNHPLWGPLHAPHHWGESVFDYYNSDDPYVLRKHAQLLGDAGVDVIIFDVTNQLTYRKNYLALLREFSAVRSQGGRTPQVAFLCPFWDPAKVVSELFHDLYEPGLHSDLWFPWEGKPLILADPAKLGERQTFDAHNIAAPLAAGRTLGQSFTAKQALESVAASCPTWKNADSAVTLTLFRDGPQGERILSARFENVSDNAWLALRPAQPLPAGPYYLEMSAGHGVIGWWSHTDDLLTGGHAFADGAPAPGDRNLQAAFVSDQGARLRDFFTFRKPQPDYFAGQTQPDMWSWLEVYPQHVFTNSAGQKEQMSVGVAQNAVGNRLGSMSEKEARGRSFHGGKFPSSPGEVLHGYNFAEQFERALQEDPRFIFVTGWNEWIAGRFDAFNGVRLPVMFVDQFDQEHSRDIEPMKGGHGDNYYYQFVSFVRRYKGVRPHPSAGPLKKIDVPGSLEQWDDVTPEFRDDISDTGHRGFPAYNHYTQLTNTSGRNDFVSLKVSRDERDFFFLAQTREPVRTNGPNWMMLLLDVDQNHRTGWEGYDFVINRVRNAQGKAVVERNGGGWNWQRLGEIEIHQAIDHLILAVPRGLLDLAAPPGQVTFDFKWADNVPSSGNIVEWLDAGDCAPNGRFNYRFKE